MDTVNLSSSSVEIQPQNLNIQLKGTFAFH